MSQYGQHFRVELISMVSRYIGLVLGDENIRPHAYDYDLDAYAVLDSNTSVARQQLAPAVTQAFACNNSPRDTSTVSGFMIDFWTMTWNLFRTHTLAK